MISSEVSLMTDMDSTSSTMRSDYSPCQRRVRFSEKPADIASVLEEQTESDRHARWYTANDLYTIRREPVRTIRALRRAKGDTSILDGTKYSVRGLEDLLSSKLQFEKKKRQKCVVKCILDEQDRIRQMGTEDTKGLQVLFTVVTRWAKTRALNYGTKDAQEAAVIFTEGLQESSEHNEESSTSTSDEDASITNTLRETSYQLDGDVLKGKKEIKKVFNTRKPPALRHREVAPRSA